MSSSKAKNHHSRRKDRKSQTSTRNESCVHGASWTAHCKDSSLKITRRLTPLESMAAKKEDMMMAETAVVKGRCRRCIVVYLPSSITIPYTVESRRKKMMSIQRFSFWFENLNAVLNFKNYVKKGEN
jgi:hypothetical protein